MMRPTSRLKRAIRASLPILGAALILGSGALAWSTFHPGSQPNDPLVVGIGASTRTAAVIAIDEETDRHHHKVFVISGNVDGLFPGGSATLPLRIHNPLSTSIRVDTLTLIAGAANAGCAPANLAAGLGLEPLNNLYTITLSPPLVIPKGKTVDGPQLPLTLRTSAPDACQNATFPLVYGGTALGADDDGDFDNDQNDNNQSGEP
jgi:hypothetical protein